MANKVIVPENFSGAVQIFATDTVIIKSSAKLTYPSGIFIVGNDDNCYIEMGENSEISGYIALLSPKRDKRTVSSNYYQSQSATLRGLLYVDGVAEVHGIVSGKSFFKELAIFTRDGIYSNTIYNATFLDGGDIAYPFLLKDYGGRKEVVKWLK